ncbi:MAG: DUF952 domain-containing protein [Deltaproteobacteria bacterium]|nr:DUF952 domain-containing protein [Deltaproteobacteria bacterium]
MRYLYHLVLHGTAVPPRYAPPSLASEGFVHLSFAPAVAGSAVLYFPVGSVLDRWRIDPRRVDVPVVLADTPRGPMPHAHGALPAECVVDVARFDPAEVLLDELTEEGGN